MFEDCSALTSLNISNFNTEKVTDMTCMFTNCKKLTTLDLSSFNTEKVTGMSGMFFGCQELTTIYVSDKFTTDNVNNPNNMFTGCSSLVGAAQCDGTTGVDGTGANYLDGYFKTYYTENGEKKELCGTDNYDMANNAFKVEEVSFDDNDVIGDVPLSVTGNITYTRQLDNEWETLCLPYGMTYDNANGKYKLYSLASANANELTFTEYANGTTIAAGTPMIIQRQGSEACQATLTAAGGIVNCNIEAPESTEWRLVGTLSESAVPEEAYVLSEGAFHKASELAQNADIVIEAPYRAYVMPAAEATAADVLNITIAANDPTAIDSITNVLSPAATYYDLSGRRIPSLRQGTNIVISGNKTKKVVIK